MYPGPIIDVHTHLALDDGMVVLDAPHRVDDYRASIEPLDVRAAGALAMAPAGDLDRTRTQNNLVLQLADADELFYAVPSVHPRDGDLALEEIDRVAAAGAKCLKLHPNTQDFDVADDAVASVVQRAADRGLPVLFDAWSPFDRDQPGKFVRLAMAVPEARLLLAHAHGPDFASLLVYEVLSRYPWWPRNVWIDISATANLLAGGPFAEQFSWVCQKVGLDRIVFGSDYPLDDPVAATVAVSSLGFDEAGLGAVMHDNARALLGV
jgi:uncharacterized protein